MNAGGNRSGTRFTPRMADAATQTYLYGSSAPIPSKANHRMGAAGGGLRDSHLLRGGARETYQRVAGIYERTGDDTVTVENRMIMVTTTISTTKGTGTMVTTKVTLPMAIRMRIQVTIRFLD